MIPRVIGKYFLTPSTTSSSSPCSSISPFDPCSDATYVAAIVVSTSLVPSRSFVSWSRWQAWRWDGSRSAATSGGSVVRQTPITYGQRGWNLQPLGGLSSDGG